MENKNLRSSDILTGIILAALGVFIIIYSINLSRGEIFYTSAGRLPENATCRSLAAWYFQQLSPSHQRTALRKALSLEAVLSQLEAIPSVELVLPAPEGAPYHLRCSPLEGMPGVLLVTCRRLPAGTPPPAP